MRTWCILGFCVWVMAGFAEEAQSVIRQVAHVPFQPKSGQPVTVTARFADRVGARSATLQVQLVEPGKYIRKSDKAFATTWRDFPMHDDGTAGDLKAGDGIYTAVVPGELQTHRMLARYRFVITNTAGEAIRAPGTNEFPNFAWFTYDGIPAWSGASQPGKTPALTFSAAFQNTLPVYHLLANRGDVERSQWDGGADHKKLYGTLVYDGCVYDHIGFHNRGKGSTYVNGKNKWGFKFNHGDKFQARDNLGHPYQHGWNSFSMEPGASAWAQINRGMSGLDEAVPFRAFQLAGVPAANTHWIHFRVIDRPQEATPGNQYETDLWGLYLIVQDVDGPWEREMGLPDGNIYSPESGLKHRMENNTDDGTRWRKFLEDCQRGKKEEWWRTNLNLEVYYSFHALNRLVGNVDIRPDGNYFFYHRPGSLWTVSPWDLDMMFIPKTHQPGYIEAIHCLDVPAIRLEYQARAREILDLFCSDAAPNGGQIGQLVEELARVLCPAGQERNWSELDMAVWNFHPRTNDKGAFFRNPCSDGRMGGGWERKLTTPDLAGFRKYLVEFCTDSRAKKNYQINDGDPHGYGFGYLSIEAADKKIPATPMVQLTGTPKLSKKYAFRASAFASPVTNATAAAVEWRLAEISAPGVPGFVTNQPCRYELQTLWNSGELPPGRPELQLADNLCKKVHTYRVRARYKDNSGRWGHWSEPVQFVAE
ncbi:MAG: CotH kinase family protein [Verrucomicrobiota bacterium]